MRVPLIRSALALSQTYRPGSIQLCGLAQGLARCPVDVSDLWCHPADMLLMPASIISNVIGSGVRLFSLTV